MEKKNIETFIKKYSLGGLIDDVRWSVIDGTLRVTSMTSDKKLLTSVLMKKFENVENSTIVIIESAKLKQMLGALGENVAIEVVKSQDDDKRILSLGLSDDKCEVFFTTGDSDILTADPKLKATPKFGVEITMNDTFIEQFNRAKAALPESEVFTLSMNPKKKKLEMVFGHGKNNFNRIAFEVPTVADKDTVKQPISFSAKILKEVLSSNSEIKDPVLKVSEEGMAAIEYDNDGFQSQYYMIRVDVED